MNQRVRVRRIVNESRRVIASRIVEIAGEDLSDRGVDWKKRLKGLPDDLLIALHEQANSVEDDDGRLALCDALVEIRDESRNAAVDGEVYERLRTRICASLSITIGEFETEIDLRVADLKRDDKDNPHLRLEVAKKRALWSEFKARSGKVRR